MPGKLKQMLIDERQRVRIETRQLTRVTDELDDSGINTYSVNSNILSIIRVGEHPIVIQSAGRGQYQWGFNSVVADRIVDFNTLLDELAAYLA